MTSMTSLPRRRGVLHPRPAAGPFSKVTRKKGGGRDIVRHIAAYVGYNENRAACGAIYVPLSREDEGQSRLCKKCAHAEGIA